jgi:DNA-binding CsgD family transcriptional regulator
MSNGLHALNATEVKLLLGIFEKLSGSGDRDDLRRNIADDLLNLLHADFLASFIWNEERGFFDNVIFLNMTPENLSRYHTYFRFCDPITPVLQKRRKATVVYEIMAQEELEKTEFFNDFLMADGLHHGINLYAYDRDLNIGDLRIWRAKNRPDFGPREALLLDTILPHFRNALRNARILAEARNREILWERVIGTTQTAVFLFDKGGRLLYRNVRADAIEEDLPGTAYAAFFECVCSLSKGKLSRTEWGNFSLSSLHFISPINGVSHHAVMATQSTPGTVDRDFLATKYRLSPREADIALLVCKGLTDQEIAGLLKIAFSTVRTHLKHLFTKLDVTNRTELIFALMDDLVNFTF